MAAARGCWQRAAVLPPGAAWSTGMRWARAATQALRRAAVAAADAVGEGGEEQEAAGGEGVARGEGECAWRRGRGLDNVFCERPWRSV